MQTHVFSCPHCNDRLSAEHSDIGHFVECPSCQKEILITAVLLASGEASSGQNSATFPSEKLSKRWYLLLIPLALLAVGLVLHFSSKQQTLPDPPVATSTDTMAAADQGATDSSTLPEAFVISFAKSAEEALILATQVSALETSTRYRVYTAGHSMPTLVDRQDSAERTQQLADALFNGVSPRFNSINHLLLNALYSFRNPDRPITLAHLIIVGDLPAPIPTGNEGILTTESDLKLLPTSAQILFVESHNPGQLNVDLRKAYRKLGYSTRVHNYVF